MSLLALNEPATHTSGYESPDITRGPMNDLGTTPGNSWWLYYKDIRYMYITTGSKWMDNITNTILIDV